MEAYPEGVPAGKNSGSTRLEPFQGTGLFAVLPGVRHFVTTPGFELKRLWRNSNTQTWNYWNSQEFRQTTKLNSCESSYRRWQVNSHLPLA
jgi:hypothetical protein